MIVFAQNPQIKIPCETELVISWTKEFCNKATIFKI